MYFLKWLLVAAYTSGSLGAQISDDRKTQLPMKIGDVNVIQGKAIQRSGVVLDDAGTVYLLSMLANGEKYLLRISRKGAVKQLEMYRGWPFILDKHDRIYALEPSLQNQFRNKIPYITLRGLKTLPIAAGVGAGVYGLALLDQTFTGLISVAGFNPSDAFWGGFIAYYGIDIARTLTLRSARNIGRGGNYFTDLLAKGVAEFSIDQGFDDYRIVSKVGSQRETRFLSQVMPRYAGVSSCIEYLTKMNLR